MKVRIVTEGNAVVGYHVVENETPAPGMIRGGFVAGPGQRVHEVEVADDFTLVPGPEEIHKKLAGLIPRKVAA